MLLTDASAIKVGGADAAAVYVGSEKVWPAAAPPGGDPAYVSEAINLGADVVVDGDTDVVNNQVLNGTGLTTDTGPDGLTSLVGGSGISIPLPALGTPTNGMSFAIVVKVLDPSYVQVLDGTPVGAGADRGFEATAEGGAANHDYRYDQRSNVNASMLNVGAGTTGWALAVGRADAVNGTYLTICHNQTTRLDSNDPSPLPTIYDWSVENAQSMPAIGSGVLEVAGVALWHDYILSDADIDTLYSTLPSV